MEKGEIYKGPTLVTFPPTTPYPSPPSLDTHTYTLLVTSRTTRPRPTVPADPTHTHLYQTDPAQLHQISTHHTNIFLLQHYLIISSHYIEVEI
ncbi:hypothetical protein E2C01_057657 [Portunus trituberculatus]|uniref:Uncharacterized protein n=1 Tax=Portunus trituberculatus TaxID=210409 RepID=A0A5B7H375_PORTR|nr:hypothetical protein [Portunus trituberculatus]